MYEYFNAIVREGYAIYAGFSLTFPYTATCYTRAVFPLGIIYLTGESVGKTRIEIHIESCSI